MFKRIYHTHWAKKSLGLEINDRSIRVLELNLAKGEKMLSAKAEVLLEPGIVEKGVIKNPKELTRKLKNSLSRAKVSLARNQFVHFALPDNLVYTHVFKAVIGQGQGIKQLVQKEYQQYIPLSEEEGEYSYKIIDKNESPDQVSTIILVAAAKKSLLAWQSFLEKQNLKIEFFDIDALAIFRGMFEKHQRETFGILDIKYNYSKFSIFSHHGLEYEFSLAIGVEDIVNVSHVNDSSGSRYSAENLKIDKKNSKLDKLVGELKENIKYTSANDESRLINKIFLSGDGGSIDGLAKYLNNSSSDYSFSLGQNVPLKTSHLDGKYFQVLGLAMRAWSHNWEKSDPFLPCIGHVCSLETKTLNKEGVHIDLVSILKKYVLVPSLALVFISLAWWFMGAVSTSVDSDDTQVEETVQEPLLVEPILGQSVEEEVDIFVIVNDIGGPLNVRQGPGTNNPVIAKVNSGSEQVLLEERDNWYRIEWPNEENAWISAGYATKVD